MTAEEWNRLEELSFVDEQQLFPAQRELYRTLLEKTQQEDEHPEDYEGHCFCQLCLSYGD